MTQQVNISQPFLSGEGSIWIQPRGVNTRPFYLGCHMVDSIEEPLGDVTLIRCPDPGSPNKWVTISSYQAPPDLVTTSIEGDLTKALDYIEQIGCPASIFVHMSQCGRRDTFTNYQRSFILQQAQATSISYDGLRTKDENGRASVKADISAIPPLLRIFELQAVRQSTTEPRALNDVSICGDDRCAGTCGNGSIAGDSAVAVGDALGGSAVGTANVDYTEDAGADGWPASADDPFGTGENISAVECFKVGRDTTRVLVARGTTDAGNFAEVAYSDDGGTTWVLVDVGSVLGQFVPEQDALFALDEHNIWLGATGGYIYYSEDGGATWIEQETGVITANDINGIGFKDKEVGFAVSDVDEILRTLDGGDTWEEVGNTGTGDKLWAVKYSLNHWWVTTAGGEIYYSTDNGDTWTVRSFSGSGTGTVVAIDWLNGYYGMFIHNVGGAGKVFNTIDGGYTWQTVTVPTNVGLNSVRIASTTLAYAVGEVVGGTAVIIKIIPKND